MSQIINEDKLQPEVKKIYLPYLNELILTNGINLVSVFIYGSATNDNFNPKHSDINNCVVLQQVDVASLRSNLKIVQKGKAKRITAPLFITEEHINTSLDVFPIEFLDMKENHILLYGKDVLSNLDIKGEHIRLFCEQQIKGKLIRIRQAFLEIGSKKEGASVLLKESLTSLIPIFRNVIRLKKEEPPVDKTEIIKKMCSLCMLDDTVMLEIHEDQSHNDKINSRDAVVYLDKYLRQLQRIARVVDVL